jgi:hypothetical protein
LENKDCWEKYHDFWQLGDKEYEVGDIVSRDGSDEHEILWIDYPSMLLSVKCTKEPLPFEDGNIPWAKTGEVEDNLIRRYSLMRKKNE